MPIHDERESVRAARRNDIDNANPERFAELQAEFTADMDAEVARQRDKDDRTIAEAAKTPPITDWADIAATVSDDVWERILNDMPVSRPKLEAIRPSKLRPAQDELPAA